MKRACRRKSLFAQRRKHKNSSSGKFWQMPSRSVTSSMKKHSAKLVRSSFMQEISSCRIDDLRKIVRNDYRCTRC